MGEIEELVIALRYFANARFDGKNEVACEQMPGSVVGLAATKIQLVDYLYRAADALEKLEQLNRHRRGE